MKRNQTQWEDIRKFHRFMVVGLTAGAITAVIICTTGNMLVLLISMAIFILLMIAGLIYAKPPLWGLSIAFDILLTALTVLQWISKE